MRLRPSATRLEDSAGSHCRGAGPIDNELAKGSSTPGADVAAMIKGLKSTALAAAASQTQAISAGGSALARKAEHRTPPGIGGAVAPSMSTLARSWDGKFALTPAATAHNHPTDRLGRM